MRRGLVAASAALVLLVACDRHDDDPQSPTPSASADGAVSSRSPSSERAAALQIRPIVAVLGSSNVDAGTTATCGDEGGRACTAAELTGASKLVLADTEGNRYRLGPVVIDGNDLANATAVRSPFGEDWAVEYTLSTEGADRFALATERVAALAPPRNALAIVVAGRVVPAPLVHAVIPEGRIQLTGDFTKSEAKTLAARLGGSVG